MMTDDKIKRLLVLMAPYNRYLLWNGLLEFAIRCNDVFIWGCSDIEPISEDDVDLLEVAIKDAPHDGPLLFCARKRRSRPQGSFYKLLEESEWPLFDVCGPERIIQLGNPEPRPTATNEIVLKCYGFQHPGDED